MLRILILTLLVTSTCQFGFAHTPFEFLEVLKVSPANEVEHSVELQSKFDKSPADSALVGPEFYARSVGCLGRAAKKQSTYLSWYRIQSPKQEPSRRITVLDLVRGSENMDLTVGTAEFFLSPTQQVESGPPDPVPTGVDHYIAYKVLDPPDIKMSVEITNAEASSARELAKPLFVCVATEEWHHDEYFEASHPRACLVVYQLNTAKTELRVNTLDQFGLNQLQSQSSHWLGVRGTVLVSNAE
jgi:hypothetical protein